MKTPPPKPVELLKTVKRYPGVDTLYHVAYYRAARVGYQDVISRSLHDFKDGCEPQTSRWISLAGPMVSKELSFDLITRVLGSREETASGTSALDRLCESIARGSGAKYAPTRLQKTRSVQALTSLGGRVVRQKELEGAYTFDATGLPGSLRILLVDDLVTTGATLEAVSKTIRQAHPGAQIVPFVLARVDVQQQNTHLDPEYFLRGAAPDKRQTTARPAHALPAPAEDACRTPPAGLAGVVTEDPFGLLQKVDPLPPDTVRLRVTAATKGTTVQFVGPKGSRVAESGLKPGGLRPAPKTRKGIDTRIYIVGLFLSLLLLGATVLIPVKKEPTAPQAQFVQLVNDNSVKSPDPIPERRQTVRDPSDGKPGVVTVPSTGLRSHHSMESRVIPKMTIRSKERVDILRRFSAETGPDWVQVRTKTGTVGWVLASVVKEVRG